MNPWLLFIVGGLVLLVGKKAMAYANGQPIGPIELGHIGNGFYLRKDVAAQFNAMRAAAEKDGVALVVTSAFRTNPLQTVLYDAYTSGSGDLAAKPGWSTHQQGVTVDIEVGRSTASKTYLWLKSNAHKFGFKNTGLYFTQQEPWHWEFTA